MVYANGTVTTYQYDNNRPVSLHVAKDTEPLLTMAYQYDPVGNITHLEYGRRSDNQWIESSERFQYDWLDRLVEAQGDYGVVTYSYDSVGNRSSQNSLIYTYNDMNELVSMSDGTQFTYDDNGNMLTKNSTDTWVYTYDARNVLTQVEKNQHIVTQFTYDGDGKRVQKTEWIDSLQDYQTIIYVYSGSNVLYEINTDTGQEASYVYGPTGRISKTVDGLTDYYHTDHVGSTRLLTDESGTVTADVTYEPFGVPTDTQEHYLYTGKEKDATGLYYYGARYYDPEIGRFITRDPAPGKTQTPQSLNRYTYCLNNPLKYTDPTGLFEEPSEADEFNALRHREPQPVSTYGESEESLSNRIKEWFLSALANSIWSLLTAFGDKDVAMASACILQLMSLLETMVESYGDTLGITGAFICLEGMGELFCGVEGGVCLTYHPDLGWAMYLYDGILVGPMAGTGVAAIAGFWTWHGEPGQFTFDEWTEWFYGIEGMVGAGLISVSVVTFSNEKGAELINAAISGWGIGVGIGVGFGVAWSSADYTRVSRKWAPLWLWSKLAPE